MNNELLKQCKDEVAKAKNFIDWPDMCAHDHYTNFEHASDKVAELYSYRQREEDRKRIEELQEDLRVTENVKLSYLQAYNRECKRVDELTEEVDRLKLLLKKWLETREQFAPYKSLVEETKKLFVKEN